MKKKKKIHLNQLLHRPDSFSERFHERTKIKRVKPLPKVIPQEWNKVYFKAYARLDAVSLPTPHLPKRISLQQSLFQRSSQRTFSEKPISLRKLSNLLYYSAGLKENKSPFIANRFYPSGGARYALEVYVVPLHAQLPKGIYHYYLKSHSLEKLSFLQKFQVEKFFLYDWVANASCLIFITAVFKRTTVKYGDKGYRYALMEAGHLGQNIYLLASGLDLACCGIVGFKDDRINALLEIDGVDESVLYAFAIGE